MVLPLTRASEIGLLELLLSETFTNKVCSLPREIGSCATRTEINNDLGGVRGGDEPCDTVVEEDTVLGDICTAWLLIDEY